ncbi:lytic transglycosylase domain-containing protein [Verminephrobacter aporrectodeae subsp. tuberculatae]|uniref:lytic transglycosylase domain-containing protein n=1 Tax=Verminephrobacter aporrectodeae TaxID=1110389 RepID=UPI00224372C7|nr:lytic transglycosylase domain-containing protein [Verminephrobacter aporrectodeae]MCW8164422.1 lytic transglycosylase domain-containing protein [Verminephrobacter aporrectodeae subsp. tuberculatae]MCW8169324.1 lytic transglycosylase domain-containing protein [Verminephrobacter aporrectodeae subsp. tuberculatae]
MTASEKTVSGLRRLAVRATGEALAITRNGLTLVGLAVAFVLIVLTARPDLRQAGKEQLQHWLQARQVDPVEIPAPLAEPKASEHATAETPKELPREQAAVAFWLSKKYRVATEPLGVLVAETYGIGARSRIDPALILAIMAIESKFNPFAQSAMGAQGLMQVMTRVHADKYQNFGGHAFDPVSNLRVGVKVLQECIARAGSLEGGLRHYAGAANTDDGGYVAKVMAEYLRLRQVAGRPLPIDPPQAPAAPSVSSDSAA